MRIYLPLSAIDLLSSTVQIRSIVEVERNAEESADQLDDRYEDAMADAAFCSLQMLVEDLSLPPCRIVAVADVVDGGYPSRWEDFESFHVDEDVAADLIAGVRMAQTQEQLDALVEELEGSPLEWFDVSELQDLRRRFSGR